MKKVLLVLTGLIFTAQAINAQVAAKVYLGPVGGIGHSWMSSMTSQEFKASPYLGVGIMHLSDGGHWAWGGDLAISHEGFKTETMVGENMSTFTANPVYLRFTPKAYYMFRDVEYRIRPMIHAGPSIAYKADEVQWVNGERMDAREVFGVGPGNNTAEEIFDKADVGIDAGAGVNIGIGTNTLINVTGSYYHGLLDVTDVYDKNRNVRLNIGVMFGL